MNLIRDGGFRCRSARVTGNNAVTAGGGGDNTAVNGAYIDRVTSLGTVKSAKLVINYTTTLAAAETLKFGAKFQDATDTSGTGVADFGSAIASTVVATGPGGGGTVTGTVEIDLNMDAARQAIRAVITPDLSASGTDTAAWSATLILFGPNAQPFSQAIGRVGYPT